MSSKLTFLASSLSFIILFSSCSSMHYLSKLTKLSKQSIQTKSPTAKYWKHKAKQDTVYSCHTFVATGLLEAEYYKEHGKKLDISEADLFLKHLKHGYPNWEVAIPRALARGLKSGTPRTLETGYANQSYALLQRYGAALETEFPYRSRTGIGIPLSMRILRTSVESIEKGIKQGNSPAELTAKELKNIKKDGAYDIFKKESKHFPSRAEIRKFAQQYDLKKQKVYRKVNTQNIKELLKRGPVGLSYRVPHHKNKLLPTNSVHVVILVDYDEKRQHFISRNSDTKYLFGNQKLTEDFLRKFATNLYYLKKT